MMSKLLCLVLLVTVSVVVAAKQKAGIDGEVMKMLKEMQERMETFETETRKLREENKKLNTKHNALEKAMNSTQADVNSMFLATIHQEYISIADGSPIIWNSDPINPGGHFSTSLGAYVAPQNGYYQFSVTKRGNNFFGAFLFLVEEQRYALADAFVPGTYENQGVSASIVVELTTGDSVRIENYGSDIVWGTNPEGHMYSWFTGHLLYAL